MMFRRMKPRTLFAFPAIIAVCLDHIRSSVVETLMYLLVSNVSSILLWIVYTMFHRAVWLSLALL